MKFKANQNLCTYISNKYKEQGSYCLIDGFYLIDIVFNDAPYFISLQNNQYQLGSNTESNSILGHLFKINGSAMLVGDNGIYHLESKNKFNINSLSLLKEEDVTITYHISLKKQSYEEIKSSALPKPYYSEYKESPEQLWRVYPSNYGEIIVPNNCTGIDIEADQYCVFNINQQQIIIGATERFIYNGEITSLSFEGHFDVDNQKIVKQKENNSYFIDDISITFFRKENI